MVGTDLKPCPFCGGDAQVQHQSRELYGDAVDWYGVYCKKQFCGYVSGQSTEAEAIEAWNSRADDYKQAAEYWQRMYEKIVRCRDCAYRGWSDSGGHFCGRGIGLSVTPDGFCAWGKKDATRNVQ